MTVAEEINISDFTDRYFTNTKNALRHGGIDPVVKYRFFMRSHIVLIRKFVDEYIDSVGVRGDIKWLGYEGECYGPKSPLLEITGKFTDLVEHETLLLQKLGWPSVCAYNAFQQVDSAHDNGWKFLDMAARHCPDVETVRMSAYAAHVAGFSGTSTQIGADTYDGLALGTMPHAYIGAFESTADAAEAFAKALPDVPLIVLVDYFGREISDSIECFKRLGGRLKGIRLDTHGGRFCEGVTNTKEKGSFAAIQRLRDEFGIDYAGRYQGFAYGPGVTVEAAYAVRKALDEAGAKDVGIWVSSGFTRDKVGAFADCDAPIAGVGTGSYLPIDVRDTYATADIVSYDGKDKIKVGREWLI